MKKETVRAFTGAIKEIVPITRYQGKAFAIGNDPKWVLVVEIKSVEKEPQQRKEGENQIAYAIHSPVKLLGIPAEKAKGRVFKFEESKLFADDGKDAGRDLVASPKD